MIITQDIEKVASIVREGGVIAYPTEAVFGLGCNPVNPEAIQRILTIKKRPAEKGLILLASDLSQLDDFIEPLTSELEQKVLPTWPGAVTWLLPAKPSVTQWVKGSHELLACRVTAFEPARKLCETCGFPLISTSANPAGEAPAININMLESYFNSDEIDAIYATPVGKNTSPSEIRDSISGDIIRPA
jgi:L-threonylcarbamoyladenylate synthase